jgi:O-acetyl-ADP-ribose deacetylase (regulator of RNase III)
VADELAALSIAFPAISTGLYRWPLDDAARIAVATVESTASTVDDLRFVVFDAGAEAAFRSALGE